MQIQFITKRGASILFENDFIDFKFVLKIFIKTIPSYVLEYKTNIK
jgi:hypothetical protein